MRKKRPVGMFTLSLGRTMNRTTRVLKLLMALSFGCATLRAQGNTPIVPLSVGNTWFYHASYMNDNHTNDLYKVIKVVTGFTADSFAVVTARWYYYASGTFTTTTEYWKNVGNSFYMDQPAPGGNWQPVYDGVLLDSAHSIRPYGGGWPITWSPCSINLFGRTWVGESRRDSSATYIYAGFFYGRTLSVGAGLGPYYDNTFSTDGIGDFSDTRITLRAVLLDGVLLGDSSFSISAFPRLLVGPGYAGSPPAQFGPISISNPSSSTLAIVSIQSSDPAFQPGQRQLTVPPGGSASLMVSFIPRTLGLTRGTVMLTTDQGVYDEFHVVGDGRAGLLVQPARVSLGSHQCSVAYDTAIVIANGGNEVLTLWNVSISDFRFQMRTGVTQIAPGASTSATLSFRPNVTGDFLSQLVFTTNSIAGRDTLTVTGTGVSGPPPVGGAGGVLSLPARLVDLGAHFLSLPFDTVLNIRNSGSQDLSINNIQITNAQFQARLEAAVLKPLATANLILTFRPNGIASTSGDLVFLSSAFAGPETLTVTAGGKSGPWAIFRRQVIDFDSVSAGSSKDDSVCIVNAGNEVLTMPGHDIHPDVFSFVRGPGYQTNPGDSTWAVIRFSPPAPGAYTGALVQGWGWQATLDTVVLRGIGGLPLGVKHGAPEGAPTEFLLEQNYPNPFNPTTTFRFALPEAARARLAVYNMLGQRVNAVVNEELPAGVYQFNWDATGVASGAYVYRLQAGQHVGVKKLVIVR